MKTKRLSEESLGSYSNFTGEFQCRYKVLFRQAQVSGAASSPPCFPVKLIVKSLDSNEGFENDRFSNRHILKTVNDVHILRSSP